MVTISDSRNVTIESLNPERTWKLVLTMCIVLHVKYIEQHSLLHLEQIMWKTRRKIMKAIFFIDFSDFLYYFFLISDQLNHNQKQDSLWFGNYAVTPSHAAIVSF